MSFYPSSVATNEYYPRHDPYAPSALYGAHHVVRNPASTPSSPYYYANDTHISTDPTSPAPPRKAAGFRRVRDARDLRPALQHSAPSALKALTTNISTTFNICNPQFSYESSTNPRRVLTKPSKPAHNDGYDNEDYDYILYVNDLLGGEESHKYLILDVLGQGTFGQVVKCQNTRTHEIVAVKVVKNKPAYFNQSMMEVTILEMLNKDYDPHDEHHILRLRDSFIHKNHLCLVFELLSSNLYELIKQNSFSGLSTQLVKVFTAQLLDALTVLKEARLIHCDLKPENILLRSLQSPQIKIIDFGSACHEKQTVYTYIQSRFYRSPEVLLGVPYTSAIDMWSLGCIAVELFLGLPLFPGTSEYNQITRIVEMLGLPPQQMLDSGKQTGQFFDSYVDTYGRKRYQLKTLEKYSREHNTNEQPGKKYFTHNTLPEIIKAAPIPAQRAKPQEAEKEQYSRLAFIDFVQGLLNLNPHERWTPQQAKLHPFITGEKFTGPFVPPGSARANADPARPYGGLPPAQPQGTRAYRNAASYNQHLNQHQANTAAAAAAASAANPAGSGGAPYRNPYLPPGGQQPPAHQAQAAPAQAAPPVEVSLDGYSNNAAPAAGPAQAAYSMPPPPQAHAATRLQHHHSQTGPHGQGSPYGSSQPPQAGSYQYTSSQQGSQQQQQQHRGRANTGHMDIVPPAIARIANMGGDQSGIGRNALTPVLRRDDAYREWERRHQTGAAPATTYPQLEYLQQQAERMPNTWSSRTYHGPSGGGNRTQLSLNTTSGGQQFQPPPAAIVVDTQERPVGLRDVMSSVRSAAGTNSMDSSSLGQVSSSISTPPLAYTSGTASSASGHRYGNSASYQQSPATSLAYDSYDRGGGSNGANAGGGDLSSMYAPLQPHQYQGSGYGSGAPPSNVARGQQQPPQAQRQATMNNVPQASGGAFYTPGASPSLGGAGSTYSQQQQRSLYGSQPPLSAGGDGRRLNNEMDVWSR
ncbi:related to YAK1-ser/thr protein kinase [Serendipita indica DSM 11827]|uniref:Related to YAK1-ser/thr protein kinase n=1 Tax=Serendipita indica (strain DSM 11827) TaxID=1109443 RepID=G4TAJ9_SERID|nr:related to YAK1-ser/thr protein kinase [Serendipita indica DSM 11827]